jgi:methyl-accepting chemotaxis protein
MHDGRARAETNVTQSQMALTSLQEISNAIQTITGVNTQIATAAAQQHAVAEEVNRNISNINRNSSATAQSAQQTIAITDQLGKLASELQHVVTQFNIGGDRGLDFETAKSAHLAWRARIRAFLDGRTSLTRQEAVSHHDCVLGKWYYDEGVNRYGEIGEMTAIEQPHIKLHSLIREIIELKEAGRMQEAEVRYREVAPLSETIIALLDSVEQKILAA